MIDITIKERKIPYGNTKVRLDGKEYILHTFQEIFYSDFHNLPTVNVVIAPTGAGKTFAFILPIIYARKNDYLSLPRGLVIAPTNALVDEMYNNFKEFVKTEKITGTTLERHGIERPKELLAKVKSANIVVTNPDIVNFIIHGGYHIDESGKRRHILNFQDWTDFFGKIDYIILDEYHLYDEEQIANILVWLMTSQQFFRNMKWFFVSATPEPLLIKFLNDQRIKYQVVQQNLSEHGRIIQGKQKIHFIEVSSRYSLYKWLFENGDIRKDVKEKILASIKNGKKIFLLFDSLREAKIAENKIKALFVGANVGTNTGLETKQKNFIFNPETYDIIITTSKAEVGVNYPVQLAYIDSGKYLRNFLQRIGRIGRGDIESEIYCIVPISIAERVKQIVNNNTTLNYYEFIDILNQSFEDVKLKEEKVPIFMGAILWSVYKALKGHVRKNIIGRLIENFPYSKILFEIDKILGEIDEEIDEELYDNLKIFWEVFKKSFRRFRGDAIQWKVFYRNQETEYDIIWVLNNAFIEDIDKNKKMVIISDFRPQKEMIVRGICTRSLLDDPYSENNIQRIGGLGKDKIEEWLTFLYSNYVGDIYIKKLEKWIEEVEIETEISDRLIFLLKKLKPVFSKKRIEIFDIIYDSGKIGDFFII